MLSTGMSKKPWIWSACKSMVSTRATPTACSMLATTLALIGTRVERGRRSWRGGGAEGAWVGEVGGRGADALGRCALERVDHDQQFHQVFVGRRAGGLHDENIPRAHVLLDFNGHFTVGETPHIGCTEAGAQVLGYFDCHAGIGIAGKNHEVGVIGLHERPSSLKKSPSRPRKKNGAPLGRGRRIRTFACRNQN